MAGFSFSQNSRALPRSQLRGLSRPLYRFPFGSHIILFEKAEDGVAIVRVFQARMDWLRYLQDE